MSFSSNAEIKIISRVRTSSKSSKTSPTHTMTSQSHHTVNIQITHPKNTCTSSFTQKTPNCSLTKLSVIELRLMPMQLIVMLNRKKWRLRSASHFKLNRQINKKWSHLCLRNKIFSHQGAPILNRWPHKEWTKL